VCRAGQAFWDPIHRFLREELDPEYDEGTLAANPYCASGTVDCDADRDLVSRPSQVQGAIERITLTGRMGALLKFQGALTRA
jgi:hypothetical protein